MGNPVEVVIVDDAPRTLEKLKRLLELEENIKVVGTAGDAESGIEEARRSQPQVILMDVNLPGIDGIQATEMLSTQLPLVPVVIISVQDDREYLKRAMQAGAREYLVKPFSADELVAAIHRVNRVRAPKRNGASPAAADPESNGHHRVILGDPTKLAHRAPASRAVPKPAPSKPLVAEPSLALEAAAPATLDEAAPEENLETTAPSSSTEPGALDGAAESTAEASAEAAAEPEALEGQPASIDPDGQAPAAGVEAVDAAQQPAAEGPASATEEEAALQSDENLRAALSTARLPVEEIRALVLEHQHAKHQREQAAHTAPADEPGATAVDAPQESIALEPDASAPLEPEKHPEQSASPASTATEESTGDEMTQAAPEVADEAAAPVTSPPAADEEPDANTPVPAADLAAVAEVSEPQAEPEGAAAEVQQQVERETTVDAEAFAGLEQRSTSGDVTVVFSGKGGVGKSTLAIALASAIAREAKEEVALVDLDLQFGDLAVLLGMQPKGSFADIASAYPNVDGLFVGSLMPEVDGGLRVLAAPLSPELADLVTAEHVRAALEILRGSFGHVVIDTSSHLNDVALEALELANRIVLVTGLGISAIKETKLSYKLFDELQIPRDRIHLVVNQADAPSNVTIEQLEANVGAPVDAKVPSQPKFVLQSISKGLPVTHVFPDAEISQRIRELAGSLRRKRQAPGTSTGGAKRRRWL